MSDELKAARKRLQQYKGSNLYGTYPADMNLQDEPSEHDIMLPGTFSTHRAIRYLLKALTQQEIPNEAP